jgi:hypothetical protein
MKTYLVKYLVAGLGLLALNLQLHAQGFALASTPGVGPGPSSVVAADINGDGKLDLISANAGVYPDYIGTLTVLTNNGIGFGSNTTLNVSNGPNSVVAADINGDGKMDLVCANTGNGGGNTLSVFTNNGNGGFGFNATYVVGVGPWSVIAVDVNGDGWVDLVTANYNSSSLTVLTNNGSGFFGFYANCVVGGGPVSVAAADINTDGKMDLISANIAGSLTILTNNGNGGLGLNATFLLNQHSFPPPAPESVIATDINNDGKVDLVFADGVASTLTVLTNNGGGSFGSNATYNVGYEPKSVIAADVNGDGKVDLISANEGNQTITVLTNNGNGSFGIYTNCAVGFGPVSVVAVDVNGDGRLDLICANYYDHTLSVLTNAWTFLPKLALKGSSSNVVVSWPSSWTGWAGWTLQQNTDLNTTCWTPFSGTIGDDGITKTVTNSSPPGNLFFRLSHP